MLLNTFRRLFSNSQNRKARRVSGSFRLELLSLEQRIVPSTNTYTSLATPLLNYIAADQAVTTAVASSLNTPITFGADYFAATPSIITANYGFEGYLGVPNLIGTGPSAQSAAFAGNVPYQSIDPSLNAPARAYYSAVGIATILSTYGVSVTSGMDTIPVVFSHPILPTSVTTAAFQVTMNTGVIVTPLTVGFLPNSEYNERQTVVIAGYWGNRILPGNPGAEYPVSVRIVTSPTELKLVTPLGLVSAVGLNIESKNSYVTGNGPRVLAAKLNVFSDLGESNPSWLTASYANSGSDLFGSSAQYRLRLYTSAGFSPDGITSILPTEFSKYFILSATDVSGNTVQITQSGVNYTIPGYGDIRVLGIADTGPLQSTYNTAYVEDHDNQYDIILSGDSMAIARLATIRMPSSGFYSPVYNPGGPGNNPSSNPVGPFTVPSSDQTVNITNNLLTGAYVTYVEIDGAVVVNLLGQPVGALLGAAIINNATGYTVNAYVDPNGKRFYSSFPVSPTTTAPLVVGTPPPTSSGGSSTVTLYDPVTGAEAGTAVPFPGFSGPVKVVSGDFNGDGVAELIAGAGFGGGPAIAILDSQTGEVIESFFAFDPAFTGGVFVAVQDTNGDGILDIIASAGPGGGPEVRIFNGANLNVLRSFYAYAVDFTGGVSVASIDFNNDGILDLVTGAGPGGAPHVKVYDGATNAIISQWYAYPISFTGGVFVAVGDIGNDGTFEVVTGAGQGGAPVVAVWDFFTGALLAQFMAYAEDFTGGVRVGVNDGNGDGTADIITGAGPGGGPQVNVFSFPALDLLFSFYSGEQTNPGGVFVS